MRKLLITSMIISTVLISGCTNDEGNSSSDIDNTEETSTNNEVNENTDGNIGVEVTSTWTSNIDNGFEITEESEDFIDSNENLFVTTNKEDLKDIIDETITYKQINKSPDRYTDNMIEVQGKIMEILEMEVDGVGLVNEIYAFDENNQVYHILYLGELNDVFKEDIIDIVGLPLGLSGFENVDGGFTNTIAIAGSYVEKVQ